MKNLINTFIKYNSMLNLSAIRSFDEIEKKHINDSIELMKIISFKKWEKILDIWTWGWFPLLPLSIKNNECFFLWLDSRKKKVKAVNDIIFDLWLKNVKCERWRIENFSWEFDYILVRAVSYINNLLIWTKNLLKSWNKLILYKKYSLQEKLDMEKLLKKYNLKLITEHKYLLFDWDIDRVIYILEKI